MTLTQMREWMWKGKGRQNWGQWASWGIHVIEGRARQLSGCRRAGCEPKVLRSKRLNCLPRTLSKLQVYSQKNGGNRRDLRVDMSFTHQRSRRLIIFWRVGLDVKWAAGYIQAWSSEESRLGVHGSPECTGGEHMGSGKEEGQTSKRSPPDSPAMPHGALPFLWTPPVLESNCHFHCIMVRDLIYVIPEWSSGFPYFLQLKSEFCNKFIIWATVSSWSCFCWLYRASPSGCKEY